MVFKKKKKHATEQNQQSNRIDVNMIDSGFDDNVPLPPPQFRRAENEHPPNVSNLPENIQYYINNYAGKYRATDFVTANSDNVASAEICNLLLGILSELKEIKFIFDRDEEDE